MQTTNNIINDVMLQFSPCFQLLGEYMEQSELKCKDCIHSHASWFSKLIRNQYGYNCTKYITPAKYDPVLGNTTPEKLGACTVARLDRSFCGPQALLWYPKYKRGLFDYIKHVDTLPKE
jgi:hypothetical protein